MATSHVQRCKRCGSTLELSGSAITAGCLGMLASLISTLGMGAVGITLIFIFVVPEADLPVDLSQPASGDLTLGAVILGSGILMAIGGFLLRRLRIRKLECSGCGYTLDD